MEINDFRGAFRWLSNFEYAPLNYKGIIWPTSEHAYQAMKTLDEKEWHRIAALPTPTAAKAAGYEVKMRPDWDQVKLQFMLEICTAKFEQNPDLMEKLLATGNAKLVEGNTWNDTYWGVCNGRGENHLGKILMKIRERYKL